MKQISFIVALFISTLAFGQQEPEIIAELKGTERIGNFITRWYYNVVGTSLVWKQSLTLYSDSTYRYVFQGGECGTFDENTRGIWKLNGNMLTLDNGRAYLFVDNKLYQPEPDLTNKNVIMQ